MPTVGFEPGTFSIQAQSSATELQDNLEKIAEILSLNDKVTFGPLDFPIRVSYFIYHSARVQRECSACAMHGISNSLSRQRRAEEFFSLV